MSTGISGHQAVTALRRAGTGRHCVLAAGAILAAAAAWLTFLSIDKAAGLPTSFEALRGRGTLRIGVDYVVPPLAPSDYEVRRPEGFESNVADDLAETVGLKVTLVEVDPGDRVSALREGRVDLLLIRLPAANAPAPATKIVETGYRSGLTSLMRSDTVVTNWEKLSGRIVCVAQGNQDARLLAERYGALVRVLKAPAKSLAQMRTGECEAAIDDEVLLREMIRQPNWAKFSATLPTLDPSRLVFAANTGDQVLVAALKAVAGRWSRRDDWPAWRSQWADDVGFEVLLEQDAPDCH
jgi:polar amino acid transport system substrate-binding protein